MDSESRPLDFALILRFSRPLDRPGLSRGSASGRNLFPVSGSVVDGAHWVRSPDSGGGPESSAPQSRDNALDAFLSAPFRLEREPPLRQLLLRSAGRRGDCLVTRVHHCAADLLSALAWIRHQLGVASGSAEECAGPTPFARVPLASGPPRARRNPGLGRCDTIWTRSARRSRERRWSAFSVPIGPFAGLSRESGGFTYNDVLVAAALETAHWWNARQGEPGRSVGVWLPVDIRRERFEGFGNGCSRIRVRRRDWNLMCFHEKCRDIRRQVDLARRNGEWAVPRRPFVVRLPARVGAPIMRAYLRRPWVDLGSLSFTHVQRWPGEEDEVFQSLEGLEVVGALHRRHPLMVAAVTRAGRTWFTMTYDPSQLWAEDIADIGQHYRMLISAL